MTKETLLLYINQNYSIFTLQVIEKGVSCFKSCNAMVEQYLFDHRLFNKFLFENDLLSKKIELESGELVYRITRKELY